MPPAGEAAPKKKPPSRRSRRGSITSIPPGELVSLFRKNTTTAALPAPVGSGPAISLDKVPAGLVNLTKTAAVSLEKSGLTGQRAAVYLVLDHSGSMRRFYADGSVQRLAEQTLALSVNLDDDGNVPVGYFSDQAEAMLDVRLDNYQGVIDRTHTCIRWGLTDYVAAMRNVIDEHQQSGATVPGWSSSRPTAPPTTSEPPSACCATRRTCRCSGRSSASETASASWRS
jgi:hypothetical protein